MRIIPNIAALSPKLASFLLDSKEVFELRFLVDSYIGYWDFDEDWYLQQHGDLAGAIPSSAFPTGWSHFRHAGYFEGRMPTFASVDDDWYKAHYTDVAEAIFDGVFKSCSDHFARNGYREGRLPSDPMIDPDWYGPRYLGKSNADAATCLDHFLMYGYRNGALPAPQSSMRDR